MSDENAVQVKHFPALAADVAKVAADTGGIVAIAAVDHAEAKGIFARLKDKVSQGVTDLDAELTKVEALLHL